jgi:hypothetical protein
MTDPLNWLTFLFTHSDFASFRALSDDELAVHAVEPEVSRVFPRRKGVLEVGRRQKSSENAPPEVLDLCGGRIRELVGRLYGVHEDRRCQDSFGFLRGLFLVPRSLWMLEDWGVQS